MKKAYTIQFVYNGVPHTYIDRTYDNYKVSTNLSDVAYTLVEAIIKADDLYVEGEVAHEIRLFGKEQELLWASED